MGISPSLAYKNIKNLAWFLKDYNKIKRQKSIDPTFPFGDWYPILSDKKAAGGVMSGHYFHQDLLVSQRIFINKPTKHIDIGSRVDGFVAHVAAFREIEVFDIRPISSKSHPNIRFIQADLMQLNENLENYTDSISCLHVIEHFGLGRYNDPIDYLGHLKGLNNIYKILMPKGKFYFSTPIGPQRIEFNAHRVFSLKYILDYILNYYDIIAFSWVDDQGELHTNHILSQSDVESNLGCVLGCAIFELIKK